MTSPSHDGHTLQAVSDRDLRRGLYRTTLMAMLLPPFLGGTLMAVAGYYPMPEFYLIFATFRSPTLIYVLAMTVLVLTQVERGARFVIALPDLPPTMRDLRARRVLGSLLPVMLAAFTTYTIFGALSADTAVVWLNLRGPYTLREHVYTLLGITPVVLVSAFPIFFSMTDLLGRYLAPRGVMVAVAPLRTKILVLGLFTPLLVDTLMLSYFANKTGAVNMDVAGIWFGLMILAAVGTLLAWKSIQQGLEPMRAFLGDGLPGHTGTASLVPASLDEMGQLTAQMAARLERERQLQNILEAAPDLIATATADGRLYWMNPGGRRLLRVPEDRDITTTTIPDYHDPEVAEHILRNVLPVSLERGFWEGETTFRRADGTRFVGSQVIMTHRDAAGRLQQISTITRDLTEQREASRALRTSEARFRSLFAAAPLGITFYDADGVMVEANETSRQLLGVEAVPAGAPQKLWPNPNIPQDLVERFRRGEVVQFEMRFDPSLAQVDGGLGRPAGPARDLHIMVVPVGQDGSDAAHGYFLIMEDVTARKDAERNVRAALNEKEVLLKEIYHRVKNNLQVVSSLLNLQGRSVEDERFQAMLAESADRVKSMALVHEQLYQSGDLANIEFAVYVRQLVNHLTAAHRPRSDGIPVRMTLGDCRLGIETAIPCGLILTELLSNAYKHAYEGGAKGEIRLFVTGDGAGRVRVRVEDDGRGLPPGFDPTQGRTLGMRLIAALVTQLDAAFTWGTDGGSWFDLKFACGLAEPVATAAAP